jgi:VWFA-related protein
VSSTPHALPIAITLSLATLFAQTQVDQPLFRAEIELIHLDVSVLNDKRQPVTGLTASDFTVLENGVARPIRAFTAVQIPARGPLAEPAALAGVAPDVATNQIGEQDGRVVIILMDRSINKDDVGTARKVATAAVEALGPNDVAAVVSTNGGVPQTLTGDKTRLINAINQGDPSTDSDVEPFTLDSPLADGRCLCGLCVLHTVTRISDAVRDAPRRRSVLLFIGSGIVVQVGPRAPSADVGCESRVRDARQTMFDSLALSNLTVYSIDPRGLVTSPMAKAATGGMFSPQKQQAWTTELLSSQGTMQVLPERTGGRAVLNANLPESKVPAIFGESQDYYVLAFEQGTRGPRDARRSIEVKVGRKGAHVYAQRQYILPPVQNAVSALPRRPGAPAAPTALEGALGGLLPKAGRLLTLALAAFPTADGANAAVRINVDVGSFAGGTDTPVPLELAVLALDQRGRPVASARQTATVALPPMTPGRSLEANVQTSLELPPGDYEVRVAVSDPARNIAASVFSQVTIPQFGSAPLSLSDVNIETSSETAEFAPTTRRVFHHADQVHARMQIYQGLQRTDGIVPVSLRARVLDANGHVVRDNALVVSDKEFTNRRAGCQIAVDVEHLPPGEYVLSFDAAIAQQTTRRAVRFAVQ